MIKSLSLRNFKKRTVEYHFGPANLVQGKNSAGKTAIADGARVIVLGTVPSKASPPPGLRMYASAYPMRIEGVIAGKDGDTILKVEIDKVKSVVKQTADVTLESIGEIDDQTRVLFNPSLFFDKAPAARITYACELVQSAGLSPDDIEGGLLNVLGASEDSMKAFAAWKREVRPKSATTNDLLANSDEFFKARRKALNEEKARMQQTAVGVTDLSAADAEAAKLQPRADVEATIAKLKAEIQALTEKIGSEAATQRAAQEKVARGIFHAKRAENLAGWRKAVADQETQLSAAIEARVPLQTALEVAMTAVQVARQAVTTPPAPVVKAEVERTDDFYRNADESQEYDARARISFNAESGKWEVDDVGAWKLIPPPAPPSEVDEEAEQARAYEAGERLSEASETANAALKAVQLQDRTIAGIRRTLEQALNAVRGFEKLDPEPSANEMNQLVAGLPAAQPSEEFAAWRGQRLDLQGKQSAAEQTIHAIVRAEQDQQRVRDAAAKRGELEAALSTISAALALITQKKTELVSGSIGIPLAIANRLAAGILPGTLVFEEGEIGMRVDGEFVSNRVFSGTEEAILMMGLTAGLAARSKLRVLILDEIGIIDVDNTVRLLRNLHGLIDAGDIDQYFVLGRKDRELIEAVAAAPELGINLINV